MYIGHPKWKWNSKLHNISMSQGSTQECTLDILHENEILNSITSQWVKGATIQKPNTKQIYEYKKLMWESLHPHHNKLWSLMNNILLSPPINCHEVRFYRWRWKSKLYTPCHSKFHLQENLLDSFHASVRLRCNGAPYCNCPPRIQSFYNQLDRKSWQN